MDDPMIRPRLGRIYGTRLRGQQNPSCCPYFIFSRFHSVHARETSICRKESKLHVLPDGVATSCSGHTTVNISATAIPMDTSANR